MAKYYNVVLWYDYPEYNPFEDGMAQIYDQIKVKNMMEALKQVSTIWEKFLCKKVDKKGYRLIDVRVEEVE